MRRAGLRVAAVLALSAAAVPLAGLLSPPPAGAVAPTASAYWVKTGTAPPTVPKGGLLVGQDPTAAAPGLPVAPPSGTPQVTGPTAISAVRIVGIDPTQPATLQLTIAGGSTAPNPSLATIAACPIQTAWNPPSGGVGDISQAPEYNCGSSPSIGKVAADNSAISWLLPADLQLVPGELDVALVPAPAGTPAPFQTAFNPPDAKSVQAASGPPATTPPTQPAPVTEPFVVPPDTTPVLVTPSVTNPPSFFSTPSPAGPLTTTPTSAAPAQSFVPRQLATLSIPGVSDDRGHRIMAVAVLFALAALLWFAGGRPARAPQRLGALAADAGPVGAAPREGGIGRFKRVRAEGPRRLF